MSSHQYSPPALLGIFPDTALTGKKISFVWRVSAWDPLFNLLHNRYKYIYILYTRVFYDSMMTNYELLGGEISLQNFYLIFSIND